MGWKEDCIKEYQEQEIKRAEFERNRFDRQKVIFRARLHDLGIDPGDARFTGHSLELTTDIDGVSFVLLGQSGYERLFVLGKCEACHAPAIYVPIAKRIELGAFLCSSNHGVCAACLPHDD